MLDEQLARTTEEETRFLQAYISLSDACAKSDVIRLHLLTIAFIFD